jgi:hypothetical protein
MKCENCNAEMTLWMGLKQLTPFRYKCSNCKEKYKVSTLHNVAIITGVIVLFAGLALGLCIGTFKFGAIFTVPFLLLGIWFALEVWTHKYILNVGIFSRIGVPEQGAEVNDD